jgi:hypothetical protein
MPRQKMQDANIPEFSTPPVECISPNHHSNLFFPQRKEKNKKKQKRLAFLCVCVCFFSL